MKVTISEFPDEYSRKEDAWSALTAHLSAERPDVLILPEMPFCDWIFKNDTVDDDFWRQSVVAHDKMIERFDTLACETVLSSRPIDDGNGHFNEAFVWSKSEGYKAIRRKWYLPDVPVARETRWFSQGNREFPVFSCGSMRAGVTLCSEIMFPEHSREIGMAGAHLIAHPRAGGVGQRWRAACEFASVLSGSYLASTNRRTYESKLFNGTSWLFTPEAGLLAETTAETPFVSVEIDLEVAEKAKSTYPRDMQRKYLAQVR